MKKLVVIGVLSLLVLTGCSKNSEPKTTVCKKDTLADRIDFVSEGDRVITQTEYDPYSFDDLVEYGSEHALKEAGKIRQEGKQYVGQDGDIMLFKFNV